jgi:hypothetical protein
MATAYPWLVFGGLPKTLEEVFKKFRLAIGFGLKSSASDRRSHAKGYYKPQPKHPFRNPSGLGAHFLHRMGSKLTLAQRDDHIRDLMNMVYDPKARTALGLQINMAQATLDDIPASTLERSWQPQEMLSALRI